MLLVLLSGRAMAGRITASSITGQKLMHADYSFLVTALGMEARKTKQC
jgi:hypothetical protein